MISSIDKRLGSCRGELDRQGQTIERSAQLVHRVVGVVRTAMHPARAGSTAEQLDGVGERKRCELEHDLTVDAEWNLAGAQDPHPGGGVEQANGERRGGVDDLFAVVEDDHCGAALEALEQRRLAADVQCGDQCVDHIVWRRRGFESGQPDAAGRDTVRRAQLAAGRDRDCRLPDPARPDDLDEPPAGEQIGYRRHLGLATDELDRHRRQVSGRPVRSQPSYRGRGDAE